MAYSSHKGMLCHTHQRICATSGCRAEQGILLCKTQNSYKLILMGDFNARVGTDNLMWEKVIGPHGVGNINNNEQWLLSFCVDKPMMLIIANTIFQMINRLKITWRHLCLRHWNLLVVIIRKRDRQDVLSTWAAECWTDHLMVRSKLHSQSPQSTHVLS